MPAFPPSRNATALVGRDARTRRPARNSSTRRSRGTAAWCSSPARRGSARPPSPRRSAGRRRARGARVLVGRCYDLTETPPYGPWRELFAGYPWQMPPPARRHRGGAAERSRTRSSRACAPISRGAAAGGARSSCSSTICTGRIRQPRSPARPRPRPRGLAHPAPRHLPLRRDHAPPSALPPAARPRAGERRAAARPAPAR